MYDLMAVEMSLKPRKFNVIPRWQGESVQAIFYAALERINPTLSDTLHNLQKWHPLMPKPFTLSNLLDAVPQGDLIQLHPTQTVRLRLTTLHPQITAIVRQGVIPFWQENGFSIHDQPVRVIQQREDNQHYSALLHNASDSPLIHLEFVSPTAFKKTEGYHVTCPDAALIFMSLFNRWNAFASEKLPDTLRDTLMQRLNIVAEATQQETIRFSRGQKGRVTGFYGSVQIAIQDTSSDLRRMIQALSLFATYSGAGVKTTVGMGQIRVMSPQSFT